MDMDDTAYFRRRNRLKGRIVERYGTQMAFCYKFDLSNSRMSRVINWLLDPDDKERKAIKSLLLKDESLEDLMGGSA